MLQYAVCSSAVASNLHREHFHLFYLTFLLANTFHGTTCFPLSFSFFLTTLLLLLGQWSWLFSWSSRLKPCHEFIPCFLQGKVALLAWTAACGMLCSIFYIVFVLHPQQDPSITLLVHNYYYTAILHIWACVSGGVDTNWCLGRFISSELNHFSCLNQVSCSGGDQLAVG